MLSLVVSDIGNGPFNLVVPSVKFSDTITPFSSVSIQPRELVVGSLKIKADTAELWNPRPNWQQLSDIGHLKKHVPILLEVLQQVASAGSLAGLIVDLPLYDSSFEAHILSVARQPALTLVQGLITDNIGLCTTSTSELSGLGGGLTPSGDDWILGCLLAAWAIKTPEYVLQSIVDAVAGRTTPLSLAWIKAAARGECGEAWHYLMFNLLNGEAKSIVEATRTVTRTGHTSGADALAGFAAVLMAYSHLVSKSASETDGCQGELDTTLP